ncbi:MAG TPA: glycosyltransferase family 4 protein, partial [Rhodanobacter sp.]|nr:glycosyltransferase family 4 protein [Rhodanobacter sp.]
MRIVLVADAFPPMRTSAAVQLRDLTREFVRQGHQITVMLPDAELRDEWQVEDFAGVEVLRLRALQTKDVNHVRRTLAEFMMPLVMMHRLRKSPLADVRWDGVIWYSPSIFHGPLVRWLKTRSACRSYLIVRDIFPEWALDVGLLHRGLPYLFFRAVARYQYAQADTIGVQTPGNRIYFTNWERQPGRRLEVLQNWLAEPPNTQCSIDVSKTKLAGRKVCVYAGNMGVAQGIDVLIDLADRLKTRDDVGFLFVGRGSEVGRLAEVVTVRGLNNVLFHEEIDPDEIPDLYAQCHVGLVALDPRHKTHNIP